MQLREGDEHFKNYDAVFFIAGITSVGTPKDAYLRISQEIPLHFADIMPDKERMTFIYLCGAGTSPDGKQYWQQVKSKTEAEIQTKGFKRAFALPPPIIIMTRSMHNDNRFRFIFVCRLFVVSIVVYCRPSLKYVYLSDMSYLVCLYLFYLCKGTEFSIIKEV